MPTLTEGLNDLFARIPVAIYRSAPDGSLLAGNPALAELLGYDSVEQMIEEGAGVEPFYVDPSVRDAWLETIVSDGVVRDFDIELKRTDGTTIWVEDTAQGVFDENGDLLYCEGALIDVSEKVRAQKAQTEFIATVSHELRNPMSVLLGLTKELSADYDGFSDSDRREMTRVMAHQAEDASWIIEDLLVAYRADVSQVTVGMEDFDVVDEIERVLEFIEKPVTVVADEGADRMVRGDPRRTRQILRNLISNAVRYGGEEVEVRTERQHDMIRIMVCDDGQALGPEEVERIFQAFQRGEQRPRDSRSVGLGLPVAKTLAGLMGGDLVYRHDGEFSSFIVTLPAAP